MHFENKRLLIRIWMFLPKVAHRMDDTLASYSEDDILVSIGHEVAPEMV